jgi:predicted dehydrogenase
MRMGRDDLLKTAPIKWGILGSANIARSSFLPALREAGGSAHAIASRDFERSAAFAKENGINSAVAGYSRLLEDEEIDAVYIALPNSLHAEWTIAALRLGKAVLCEKPLCISADETRRVLAAARETHQLLWEAFVYPFRQQTERVGEIIAKGDIGTLSEIQSNFHFTLRNRQNIRLNPQLGGGALYDVGCYPISLARFFFADDAVGTMAMADWGPEEVDEEMQGLLSFSSSRRLVFSCGMRRPLDTFARLIGTEGEIRLTHPFHPKADDTVDIRTERFRAVEQPTRSEQSFTPALRHIHATLLGHEQPRHLATEEALGNALAIDAMYQSARTGNGAAIASD